MSEDFKNDNIDLNDLLDDEEITVIELEGERYEVVDMVTYNGKKYIAVTPYDDDDIDTSDEESDFAILEVEDDPDDEEGCILRTIEDDELYTEIGNAFLERFGEEEE